MGRYITREEDVAKISISLFITNFPEFTLAKELFNACKQYGHVVDTFIPTKHLKAGKRFGFVRFINVFSVERLVNNLRTVWIDRLKLHANVTRFNRASMNSHNHATQNVGGSKSNQNNTAINDNVAKKDSQSNGLGRTYMHVMKGQGQSGIREEDMSLAFVRDDNCLMSKDVSKCWVLEFIDDEDEDDQTDDQYDDEIKNGGINGQETGNGVNSDADEVPETTFEIPPGYTPIEGSETSGINEDGTSNNYEKVNEVNVKEFQNLSGNGCSKYSKEVESDSICSGRFKKSKGPKTGGSILNLLDEVVKVGQVMRYKMDGCMSNMVEIIESQRAKENCWGNLGFEYVHSDSVRNSGGILCVWDPNAFCKSRVTILDSFVMMRGVWRQSGKDVLLIAVYAPHDFKEKLLLWDYLNRSIGDGMGSAGLVEVSLGGCSFTWCHKLATKMSKLDRFLASKTLFNSCPNISALCLERYLSDHQPILLRESYFDYGPTLFRFFHYWSNLEGFGNVVEAAWKEYPNLEQNAMINMMDKVINKKRNLLNIQGIMVDGSWVDEPSMVKREFFNHFRNRFDKPDGIHAITHMEEIPKGCNSSFIALIPKIPDANLVKDFRPISLIGSLYKIIAKILANRLAGVLGDIVNERVKEAEMFKGIKIGPTVTLSHMFYADDVVFVGKWYESNITTLVYILDCFHRAFGLKINMSKSKILGVHVESDRVKEAALRLGCLTLKTPFLYLGSKVGGSMSRLHKWDEVVEQVKMWLSKWKMKSLSIGGRLTLLKSVLGSMTIFNMSIFKVPFGVLHTPESIRSHFFNGHALRSNKAS
uniref:RNA-directed DNA polymerase, eukaryota n=1 Tax=Tanacetum cinerariifolium TaxID=118510 RepID=A0A699GXR8_TANCI|nr:RNA-directed DNA polymerase, eukaryota [Tanacetum cinerariifolium]